MSFMVSILLLVVVAANYITPLSGPGAAVIGSRLAEICLIQALRADAIRVGEIPVLEDQGDAGYGKRSAC